MVTDRILSGGVITIRQIELTDCTSTYVKWLNEPEVNQYLETRWVIQDNDSIKKFVRGQRENDHSILFAITLSEQGTHIGNIKIGPVNHHHGHGDISYFIGDKRYWNRGIATKAINLVCRFGFEELKLRRIEAGCYADAVGSWKALEKNGFVREGTFREQVLFHDTYMDIYRYGLLRREWKEI